MLLSVYIVITYFFPFIITKSHNIVVFLTDDQDILLNGLVPMTKTIANIANEGITFQNYFVNAPICCPSRSSILMGQYPHNTLVKNNSFSGNCAGENWQINSEPNSVAVVLSNAGYTNFYAGKYLNEYGEKVAGGPKHVPKGWHSWFGLVGNSKYYNYTLSENGKAKYYKNKYLTDVIAHKAVSFLKEVDSPFFMILSTPAPHAPFIPADRHIGKFAHEKALRNPSFNYTPYEKHWLLNMPPVHLPTNVKILDHIQQKRFESLLAVDDFVEKIIKTLKHKQLLDNTYLIFTSDNGYHIGQFGQAWDKRQPYDTDIRVPLLIRGPKIIKKSITKLAVQSIDLAPTILSMANIETPSYMDGYSFLDKIQTNYNQNTVKNILIEYNGEGNAKSNDKSCSWGLDNNLAQCRLESWCKCQDSRNNTYNCVRQIGPNKDFLFCKMSDNENFTEAYNMLEDLYQLNNIYKNMTSNEINFYELLLKKLLDCKGISCKTI